MRRCSDVATPPAAVGALRDTALVATEPLRPYVIVYRDEDGTPRSKPLTAEEAQCIGLLAYGLAPDMLALDDEDLHDD